MLQILNYCVLNNENFHGSPTSRSYNKSSYHETIKHSRYTAKSIEIQAHLIDCYKSYFFGGWQQSESKVDMGLKLR
jgi:hypothetical protein